MKHKHYDLIVAWANDPELELQFRGGGLQSNCWYPMVRTNPDWNCETIRIKPKEPLVRYARASCNIYDIRYEDEANKNERTTHTYWSITKTREDNIKATFDPDTMKLLSVELI